MEKQKGSVLQIYLVDGAQAVYLNEVFEELTIFLAGFSDSVNVDSDLIRVVSEVNSYDPNIRLRCLLSYHSYKKADLSKILTSDTYPQPEIMADSGAFSASTLGVSIDINEYAKWVKRWSGYLTSYANLDVIGNPEKTLENQRILEDKGLQPFPVFHANESWDYLEYYLENYDYIALGGLVPHASRVSSVIPWLIKAFKMLPEGKGYHGFGVTGWEVLKSFPWRSVDSTSWSSSYRFGRIPLFSPVEGKFVSAVLSDRSSCYKYRDLFKYAGYDWEDFANWKKREPITGSMRKKLCGISAISFLRAGDWLRKRHSRIGVERG